MRRILSVPRGTLVNRLTRSTKGTPLLFSRQPSTTFGYSSEIFDYDLTSQKEKILYSFGGGGADGANPLGSLIQVGNILYGTTGGGGVHNDGAIFEYNLTTGFESLLYSFSNVDGQDPKGSLTLNGSNLYGLTASGGAHNFGVLFSLPAATLTWSNSGASGNGTSWDIGANQNWNNSTSATTYSDGSNIIFNDGNDGHWAITLNEIVSPASVDVSNSAGNYIFSGSGSINGGGALTKNGTGTLTLSTVNAYSGGTIVNAGTLMVGVHAALPNGALTITGGTVQLAQNTGVAQLTSLSIASGSVFDITNNHFILTYANGTQAAADTNVRTLLKNGYNGGAWTGTGGIISTDAQGVANNHFAVGYADGADGVVHGLSSGQILVQYTLYGDADLDLSVTGNDFTILTSNLGKVVNAWDKGDFDYDGLVTGNDFTKLVGNLGRTASGADIDLPASDWAAVDAFAIANGLMADVPEPACGTVILLAMAGAMAQRRRTA